VLARFAAECQHINAFGAQQLRQAAKPENAVQWLDSSNKEDRKLLASMFQYCTDVYAAYGVERDCVIQCHPKGMTPKITSAR